MKRPMSSITNKKAYDTDLRCLRECITSTLRFAYAHHIQRLMITGNFALLAGISPVYVEEWYLSVYAEGRIA